MNTPVLGSWTGSYGSWIYNYLCNQCLSLLCTNKIMINLFKIPFHFVLNVN